MSRTVAINLPDEVYAALARKAAELNQTPEHWILHCILRRLQVRDERLRSFFGSVDSGAPLGIDNEEIDAELAREYLDSHDEPETNDPTSE